METPRSVIEKHQSAINERDLQTYIETVIFPFTYQNFNGVSITVNSPEEYGANYLYHGKLLLLHFPIGFEQNMSKLMKLFRVIFLLYLKYRHAG